jgi:hypothetical protein
VLISFMQLLTRKLSIERYFKMLLAIEIIYSFIYIIICKKSNLYYTLLYSRVISKAILYSLIAT